MVRLEVRPFVVNISYYVSISPIMWKTTEIVVFTRESFESFYSSEGGDMKYFFLCDKKKDNQSEVVVFLQEKTK